MPKIYALFEFDDLEQHINDRVVSRRYTPDSDLAILNYTARAQYENIWDDVTRQCRGLIYDTRTMDVVARPFQKFFNYNDARHPETMPENLPVCKPSVTQTYDGSLGILFQHHGKWNVATRGSFDSPQAKWATAWIHKQKDISFPEGWTPLVEIIYAENKIVVDYDYEGLVLIGMVNNETGAEIAPGGLRFIAEANGLRPPTWYPWEASIPELLLQQNIKNQEGYVLSWHVGDGAPLRVKVKFEDYCRLHRLVHQTSPVTIWEMLRDGKDVEELVVTAPDAMREWVTKTREKIFGDWHAIYHRAYYLMNRAPKGVSRKEFAEYAKQHDQMAPLLFALLDGKRVGDMVWKMVRPESAQPFKQEEA